mmetsp:Transcript_32406/g.52443  ORF Transcript_32406/g.52443 Transcript_32406/m.52443 type:complete len:334 (-) Transcript_32406:2271-3272(-)|eukprot:CAMPEP_0184347938 /NCGR_PEP_ID=MMETSP1089-20130417/23292_1 /TAXON_ID=38269 ORGANISM="Gloeochaete wittrockiana, Strain SAG46.84" /NCGR_SAMPLE_ID=MMETSP1089 /ASSEMBLY_ACC=CAM_ASM_000445 /LENGTH=333 /DNA_ID=CAMNT_0026679345 /DNA_START=190 /DNA_END=1191 /DNA_ORIENTATION=-
MAKKTILVTGGAGFVGSHLCERLLRDGNRVICLDNMFTGVRTNVAHLEPNPEFTVIEHDVVVPWKSPEKLDQIYNLACPAAPGHYQYDPISTMKTAVIGVLNMLELAREHGARILQASTSEVYGDPDVHPQVESYRGNVNPIGPRACYDEGKRAGETLMFDYNRMYKTEIRVIRIFNTYGPRMHPYDGRVVSNFIRQAIKEQPITIYGDGTQTRSFQYVDDLVEGAVRMMNNDVGFLGPVNLGNPDEFTMNHLADLVLALSGSTSPIIHLDLPADDPTRRRPDNSLANKMLDGWKPKVPLREGLQKTIAYFKSIDFTSFVPPTANYAEYHIKK